MHFNQKMYHLNSISASNLLLSYREITRNTSFTFVAQIFIIKVVFLNLVWTLRILYAYTMSNIDLCTISIWILLQYLYIGVIITCSTALNTALLKNMNNMELTFQCSTTLKWYKSTTQTEILTSVILFFVYIVDGQSQSAESDLIFSTISQYIWNIDITNNYTHLTENLKKYIKTIKTNKS